MPKQISNLSNPRRNIRRTWVAVLVWTLLIGASLSWNAFNEYARVLELAKAEGRANLNKDKAFRLWATSKGGFYIPVSEQTKPSPFMAHVPFRDVTTVNGKVLTLFNPATVIKETGEQFQELSGVQAKITNKIYLNPENAPDAWELKALRSFEQGAKEVAEITDAGGTAYLRLAFPMKMEAGCLKCHEGKAGGLGGSTGVSIPLAPYRLLAQGAVLSLAGTHGGIWLAGLGLIGFIARRTRQYESDREVAENELRKLSLAVKASASAIMIMNEQDEIQYVNARFCEITGYEPAEVIGKPASILKAGSADLAMHRNILTNLQTENEWRGERINIKKSGTAVWCLESMSSITNDSGQITNFVAVMEDISERKQAEETIKQLAYYDPLTDLPNRRQFRERLEHSLACCRRSGGQLALFYLDVDRFKTINDTLGHGAGDVLLKTMAQRLSANLLRDTDVVARLGGDEFAVIIFDTDGESAARIAEKLISGARRPMQIGDNELHLTVSVGISMFPADTDDPDELIRFADIALYEAKAHGKNTFRFYSKDTNVLTLEHLQLENDLRLAIERQEFFLEFQPQIDLRSDSMFGAEALIRWNHPQQGRILPRRFIPLAEDTHLIEPIGTWVLRETCRQMSVWDAAGLPPFMVSVNVSALQFRRKGFVALVKNVLAETGIAAERLGLEITESVLMKNPDDAGNMLQALRKLGVRISIDDFGTGYSSLDYLRRFSVNSLKIDQSFVKELGGNSDSTAIAETIVTLGRTLKLTVIAEGVETEEQLAALRRLGCEFAQGHLFSHPIAPEAMSAILQEFSVGAAHKRLGGFKSV